MDFTFADWFWFVDIQKFYPFVTITDGGFSNNDDIVRTMNFSLRCQAFERVAGKNMADEKGDKNYNTYEDSQDTLQFIYTLYINMYW